MLELLEGKESLKGLPRAEIHLSLTVMLPCSVSGLHLIPG